MDSSATLRFSDRHQFVADFWLTHLLSETNANVRITLATGQKFVFAHTAALILASEYIQTILTSSESNEDGIFDISLPDFTFEVAQSFLKLLYTGSADTHVEEMKEICSMFGVNVTTTKKVGDDEGNTSADDDAGPLPPTPVTLNSEEDSSSDEEKSDDEVALTVKLEENLTKAKLQDNRRRKSSTTTIAQQQQKEAALQPKNKRVLMADMDQTELTCGVCGKEFHILYKLKLHKLIHSSSPPFVCSMCGKGFNNKYKMRVHEKNHVSVGSSAVGEGNKKKRKKKEEAEIEIEKDEDDANRERPKKDPLTCEYCDASQFQTKAALNEHIGAAHPNFKRFLCCTCGKGFRGQKGKLN
jgi:transcription elongation factor Elf1